MVWKHIILRKIQRFKPGPVMPNYTDYIVFEGISVNEFSGKQTYLDANTAYRNACLNAIEFLKHVGSQANKPTCYLVLLQSKELLPVLLMCQMLAVR